MDECSKPNSQTFQVPIQASSQRPPEEDPGMVPSEMMEGCHRVKLDGSQRGNELC